MPESEAIRVLAESVDALTDVIDGEKQARRQGNRRVAGVIAAVAVLAAVGTAVNWNQLQTQKSDRAAARLIACESYNTDTVDQVNNQWLFVARRSDNPEALAIVVDLLLPRRDCSPSGIADYFDGDPTTDPFDAVTLEDYE